MKRLFFGAAAFFVAFGAFSQEALKSTEEEYYDFLSLTGITERPTLGYRTLSDSEWFFNTDENGNSLFDSDENVWKNNNLGKKRTIFESDNEAKNWFTRGIDRTISYKIFGPEWYNSFNTSLPYGQNDGVLWQGKGYNTSLTGGARLEAYGFELTLKPQVSFSQNLSFDLMDNSAYYTNKYAYIWSYSNNVGIDLPQRFGDSAFATFDWGDSEIRWSWKNFTIGFGTQSPWIGAAWLNPMLHSNNAASYPKFDIGLRKTPIRIPYLGWYIGDIEARLWMGYLTESDYFDDNSSNDHNRINGFIVSYAPSFLKGFSFGLTKVCLTKWDNFEIKYLNPMYDENGGIGTEIGEDQKFSLYIDWLLEPAGFEVYGEIGIDDYTPDRTSWGIFRYPFDTMIYTVGLKKSLTVSKEKNIRGEIIFEWNSFSKGEHRATGNSNYSYYYHSQIVQGYTNKGQCLGSGLGPGMSSQYVGFKVYYPKGDAQIFVHRYNVDNDYAYSHLQGGQYYAYKANLAIGLKGGYYITPSFYASFGTVLDVIINPYYKNAWSEKENKYNFNLNATLKYSF